MYKLQFLPARRYCYRA